MLSLKREELQVCRAPCVHLRHVPRHGSSRRPTGRGPPIRRDPIVMELSCRLIEGFRRLSSLPSSSWFLPKFPSGSLELNIVVGKSSRLTEGLQSRGSVAALLAIKDLQSLPWRHSTLHKRSLGIALITCRSVFAASMSTPGEGGAGVATWVNISDDGDTSVYRLCGGELADTASHSTI